MNRLRHSTYVALVAALLMGAACKTGHHEASHKAHWSYAGETGPEKWGDLGEENKACKIGNNQSPINLANAEKGTLPALKFDYKPTTTKVVNNGHTIQFNVDAGSTLSIGDKTYNLLQFHFHTPSEHTVEGKALPLEVHFVHKNDAGNLAVVGVFFQEGKENTVLKSLWANLPAQANGKAESATSYNAKDFLPADQRYFAYPGSLTTPPCSENVSWNVIQTPIEASAAQIAQFKGLFSMNARPVQALRERKLLKN